MNPVEESGPQVLGPHKHREPGVSSSGAALVPRSLRKSMHIAKPGGSGILHCSLWVCSGCFPGIILHCSTKLLLLKEWREE